MTIHRQNWKRYGPICQTIFIRAMATLSPFTPFKTHSSSDIVVYVTSQLVGLPKYLFRLRASWWLQERDIMRFAFLYMYVLQHVVCMGCSTIYPFSFYLVLVSDSDTAKDWSWDHFVKFLRSSLLKDNENLFYLHNYIETSMNTVTYIDEGETFWYISYGPFSILCSPVSRSVFTIKRSVSSKGRTVLLPYATGYGSDTQREKS